MVFQRSEDVQHECSPSGRFVCFSFKMDLDLFTCVGNDAYIILISAWEACIGIQHTLSKIIQCVI